jgi:phage tail-like protein
VDANGIRFHLLDGERDWRPLLDSLDSIVAGRLAWDAERAAVSLAPRLLRFGRRASETPPARADRRGAARDRFGTVYWIGPGNDEILYQPAEGDPAGRFWSTADLVRACEEPEPAGDFRPVVPPPPPALPRLRGLAVTGHHYLVAGTLEPAGLLIFDLHAGGPPFQLAWPAAVPFAPLDLSPAPGHGVWVLSGDPGAGESRLWRLDRWFRVCRAPSPGEAPGEADEVEIAPESRDDFRPVAGGPPRVRPARLFPAGRSLDLAVPGGTTWAVSVAGLPDGSVLLLESDPLLSFSRIFRLRGERPAEVISLEGVLAPVLEEGALLADPEEADLRGHDLAFVPLESAPGTVRGELFVASSDGNQTFAFRLAMDRVDETDEGLSLDLLPRYLPMRRWSGKALLETPEGATEVFYDLGDRWLPLVEQPRRRYASEGRLATGRFDSREPGCVWHRLLLDAVVPPGDVIAVESRAADDPRLLAEAEWRREPDPRLRASGSELPFHDPFPGGDCDRSAGTWELLLQEAVGRYLELRLTLRGSGRTTPRLRSLRVYGPRFSYLREYLPAVYRDEPVSASFLDRFLANPEGLFTAVEGRIERAETLFDIRTAPPELLEWLAGWLGAVLDPAWDEARRRLFLAYAAQLFRWRGTPAGLIAAVRLATDPCPDESVFEALGTSQPADEVPGRGALRIVESFLTRSLPGVVLGDPTEPAGPGFAAASAAWEPAHGAAALHAGYRDFLRQRYREEEDEEDAAVLERLNAAWGTAYASFAAIRLSPVLPENPVTSEDWLAFTGSGLGFTWAVATAADTPRFQGFLARRYRRMEAFGAAWGIPAALLPGSFAAIPLPDELPDGGAPLADWIRFVSLVLPVDRNAHRFTVLVPTEPGEGLAERERRRGRVNEIVAREKPAHTEFEVKLFWALFQVGTARLGLDTALGEGSRYTALVLGTGFLGDGYLAETHPWNVTGRGNRLVPGGDRIPPFQGEPKHVYV